MCRHHRAARSVARATAGLSSRPSLPPQRALPPVHLRVQQTTRHGASGSGRPVGRLMPIDTTRRNKRRSIEVAGHRRHPTPAPLGATTGCCCACLFAERRTPNEKATALLIRALIGPRSPHGPSTPPCAPRALTPRPPGPPNPPRRGHTPRVMSSRRGFGGGRSTGAGQLPRSRRGTNRTVAVAVARATSTCRPRTSARPSERETVPLDARRRVASLGATAERVGLGVNSYRDARRPTTGSSRRSALGTCLLGRQQVRLPQPNQRTAANKAYNSFWVPSRFIFWVGLAA